MGIAIQAEHLSKEYRLGAINHGMLYKDIQSWLARKTGREDPHERIGADHYADRVDRFWALKDLNFEIEQGDRVGIIGRNGAGKSTLLKILSRITAPTEGSANIRGRVASLLEVGTGFHPELSGRENIYLNGAILGMKRGEIARKLDEIVDFSEIEQYLDTPVKRYSSGMYVRLAFAVAAHLDSEILLADEVLAVGDATFQEKALGKMNSLSSGQGRTVLFVSHNMGSINALCNKGMFLEKGRLVPTTSLDDCVGLYMSSSDPNVAKSEWDGDEGNEDLRLKRVSLRPEDENLPMGQAYSRGEKLRLLMRFEILRYKKDFGFCVEVLNRRGSKLCEVSALESTGLDAEALSAPGSHELCLTLDTSILAEGIYFLKFDFAIRNIVRIIGDIPTLQFELVNRDAGDRSFIPWRHDVVSPQWIWSHRADRLIERS